ncbi:hypothetical protein EUGRSUZ_H02934 [Eucalyptus grandis]|uniref:Uncharacterized protein n=2 Tax=Eucalyptus grandis TaxID=71139 RepID=A0ACC3JT60_EUCGR|nr:hypothetical protein EUGRSUZ_H02934 [Eucalyptus grandis]
MAESIPEDVVVDILLRLPAKSLVRFKCVCKRWRSLISDRAFAKSHLQRVKAADLIPSQRIIIGGRNSPLKTVDYEALDGGGEGRMVVPHGIKPLWESRIVGSCDGLVCLLGPSNFVIYNPTTGEYIELPSSDFVDHAMYFSSGARYDSFYGFGYDSQSDDYKIALVVGDVVVEVENWKVAIFSLKSCSWRMMMIEVPFQEEGVECCGPAVYWKGALHWDVYVWNTNGEGFSAMLSFDLLEEKFHQVLPVPAVDDGILLLGLEIHGANLFIYNNAQNPRIEAWITDQYRIGAPWKKWLSVDCSALNTPFEKIPLAYTRSEKIVFLMGRKWMIMFNPEDNTCREYLLGTDLITEYAIYLETLVSPYLGGGAVE